VTALNRALGAFYGLALGDALGMPTQSLSRAEIKVRFGKITDLEDAGPDQPIAANMLKGSITDDTEQAILVGQLLVEGEGRIEPSLLAQRLIEWEADMQAKGSQDLLGPSTKRAIEMILAGHSPEEAGRYGTTNGAAMRITPVGSRRMSPTLSVSSTLSCRLARSPTTPRWAFPARRRWRRWFRPVSTAWTWAKR